MFVKTTKVTSRGKRYEYLTLVESYRDQQGNPRQCTIARLGEATKLRETGQLDRIIAALRAHAQGTWVRAEDIQADGAPSLGPIAAVAAWWERLRLGGWFERVGSHKGLSWSLADATFAMVANRLVEPASKRKVVGWIADKVVAPDGFTYPSLECYCRALDHVHDVKASWRPSCTPSSPT